MLSTIQITKVRSKDADSCGYHPTLSTAHYENSTASLLLLTPRLLLPPSSPPGRPPHWLSEDVGA